MKTFKQGLLISTFLLSTALLAGQGKEETNNELTINAIVHSQNQLVKNERILLYLDGQIIETIYSDKIGNFRLSLKFDKTYYLVFGSEKYDVKWIELGTKIPLAKREENHKVNLMINVKPKLENPVYRIIETVVQN